MITFLYFLSPPADSYTNLFGPVSPKVCTLNYNRNHTFYNLGNALSPFSRCDHLGVVLCQKLPRSQCTGNHSMISSSSNLITKISMLRPRNSKTFTSCLWWIFKCHRSNMMSTRQVWWHQSKVYQWKDSMWMLRWNWSCSHSSFSKWKWCCCWAMLRLVTKIQQIYVKRRSLSFVNIRFWTLYHVLSWLNVKSKGFGWDLTRNKMSNKFNKQAI